MKAIFKIIAATAWLWLPIAAWAQDDVYPSGSGVISTYLLSSNHLVIGDTLEITRSLINGSADNLRSLYFSDYLLPSFELVSSSITLNGLDIAFGFEGPVLNEVITGHESYRWTVDSPFSSENLNQVVAPGDSVVLTARFVPQNLGQFDLPMHCAAFSTASGGFAVSPPLSISVTVTASVDDDSPLSLPDNYLTSLAYPNPFNGEVTISFSGLPGRGLKVRVAIYNAIGQKVDEVEAEAADTWGLIEWKPDEKIGSGLYLYRISAGNMTGSGKVLLLK